MPSLLTVTRMAREGLNRKVLLESKNTKKIYPDLVRIINDRQAFAEIQSVGDFGLASPRSEYGQVEYQDFALPYSKQWSVVMRSIGFLVSEESQFVDLYNIVSSDARAKRLAKAMDQTKDAVAAASYNLGFSTAAQDLGPDGLPLFSTAHTLATGTAANRPATDLPLSVTALEQAIQELMLQKSHRGNPMPQAGPFNLYVHPLNYFLARRIVETAGQQGVADNDKNVVGGFIARVIPCTYFTSTTAWFLRNANDDDHGIFILNRMPRTVKIDDDIDSWTVKVVTGEEYVRGHWDWRGAWGTTGV